MSEQSTQALEHEAKPWGFFQTFSFGFLAVLGYAITQMAVLFFFVDDIKQLTNQTLEANGDLLSFTTIASTVVICLLILLFSSMRKNYSTRAYLGLVWPSWKQFFFWLLILVAANALMFGLFTWLGLPVKSQVMIDLYKSAHYAALFWVAVVIAAPFSEEFFFRGFLLEGWRKSFLGVYGAVIVTAVFWGIIHVQYPAHMISAIVVMGIIFALARVKTGSLYLVILLHAINNFVSMLEMHFLHLS